MDNLAHRFIAKLRAHGHRPYVHNGGFGIEPSVLEPTSTLSRLRISGPSLALGRKRLGRPRP
jgi:hypothetical protein